MPRYASVSPSAAIIVAMTLFGRDEDLGAIRRAGDGVWIIEGDSGTGKSALIGGLDTGWSDGDVVPGARVVGSMAGSLQAALADEIAEAFSDYTLQDSTLVNQGWRVLVGVLDKASSATAREAGRLLIAAVLDGVERKLGKATADVGRAILEAAGEPIASGLESRLRDLSVPDVASQLLALADDVGSTLDGRLILRVDQADVLGEHDIALLADLAERSIPSLVLIAGFSTASASAMATLAALESRGAHRHRVRALSEPGLAEWLAAEQVPRTSWGDIARTTSGYPFFVDDAIRLVKAGQPLAELKTPSGFASLLDLSWKALPLNLRPIAMTLAGLREPPPDEFITGLLELTQVQWAAARRELLDSNVFVRRPDNSTWFHDRRRDYIWNEIAGAAERASVADGTLVSLRAWQASQKVIFPWVMEALDELVPLAASEVAAGTYLGTVHSLGREELSVLFALVELVEPSSDLGQFANTSEVVAYAIDRFGVPASPVEALERLHELALIAWQSNDHVSIVGLVLPEPLAYAAVLARISTVMERIPYPRFASTMFGSVIRPLVVPFKAVVMSAGQGSLRDQKSALIDLRKLEVDEEHRFRTVPGLGIVACFDARHFTATVSFETTAERDEAHDRLLAYERDRRPDETPIESLNLLPPEPVPSGRLKAIARRVRADEARFRIANADDVRRWVEHRTLIAEAYRKHLSDIEASSLRFTSPRSALLGIDDDLTSIELTVAGSDLAEVRRLDSVTEVSPFRDPLLELKLVRDGYLRRGERIVHVTQRGSGSAERSHPLREEAERAETSGAAFNRGLDPIRLTLDEEAIAERIRQELRTQSAILEELISHGVVTEVEPGLTSRSRYLHLAQADWAGIRVWQAQAITVSDGRADVSVRIGDAPLDEGAGLDTTERLALAFGVTRDDITSTTTGIAESVVGGWLGFAYPDVRFERSPE